MTRFLLIRHGSTDAMHRVLCGRLPGFHLSERGREEARKLGRKLAAIRNLEAVYSSPLERAQETAAEIATPHNLPVIALSEMDEIDFGAWAGHSIEGLRNAEGWEAYNRFRAFTAPPLGESLVSAQTRAWECMAKLCEQHGEATVAVVSHGDVIRGLLLFLLGMPIDSIFRLEISPASVSAVSAATGMAPIVHSINQTFEIDAQ